MSATLPDPQTAFNNVFMNVSQRVFFEKCAAAGYAPRSADEAQWMLDVAGKLEVLEQHAGVKQAAATANPYMQASQELDAVMGRFGLMAPAHDMHLKQAALAYASEPALYNSILALAADEAQAVQAQLQAQQAA